MIYTIRKAPVFETDDLATGLHMAFSPNACAAVMLDAEGQTQLRLTEHTYGAEGGLHDESKYFTRLSYRQACY